MAPAPDLSQLIGIVIEDKTGNDVLDQLVNASKIIAELQETSDVLLGHFVEQCRSAGLTWLEISTALGFTKQAVHKAFGHSLWSPRSQPTSSRSRSDESELEYQFERCSRPVVGEVPRIGFFPGGCVGLIDQMGVGGATHHLLSSLTVHPLFHFLVGAKRIDPGVEWAVLQPEWRELFEDAERTEAHRRLAGAAVELSECHEIKP